MRLEILLEPPGAEAENTLRNWLETFSLSLGNDKLVNIGPDNCFALLTRLRDRCYERGLTVNVKFHGKKD